MSVLDNRVDWNAVSHAYAVATDTPVHLANLLGPDQEARDQALDHLWAAVLHQGTIYPATAPAADAVADLLSDPRLDHLHAQTWNDLTGEPPAPLRASLLDFLAEVAVSCRPDLKEADLEPQATLPPDVARAAAEMERGAWSDEPPDEVQDAALEVVLKRATIACRRIAPKLFDAVVAFLDDADPAVRISAANAAARLSLLVADRGAHTAVVQRLEAACERASVPERAALALSLGDLGVAPRTLLADQELMVRACAALAPALAGDPTATAIVVDSLARPNAVDGWLPQRTPQLEMRLRFRFVRAAIERVGDFDELLPGAIAIARIASKYTVDNDWGPLLRAAFPWPAEEGTTLSPAQRSFLDALVGNPDLWDPRLGNPRPWLAAVGLPYDRAACREIAERGTR